MSLRYLIDKNILSEPLRPRPNSRILERLTGQQLEIAIASVVWHEMWFGCYRLPPSARRRAIELYLTQMIAPGIPILPYDQQAASWHAAERARLAALGKTPPFADGMIAAIARTNNLTVVTMNLDDYRQFSELRAENWLM